MKSIPLFAATATATAAALSLAACSGAADDETATNAGATAEVSEADNASVQAEAAETDMVGGPQQFVDTASASDAYEMEAAGIAADMGTSQAVKDFAAMMKRDHAKSTADLKAAVAEVAGVSVNPQMNAKQRNDLDMLRKAGDDFDATYARQQVSAHEMALETLRTYASGGEAQPLKDFAAATAPVVDGHLKMARDMK